MNSQQTEVEERPEQQDDGLLSRWAKRKRAVLQETQALQESKALDAHERLDKLHQADEATLPADKDMPPVELLTADSDFSGFMSPNVSEALRRLALRKLFHGAEFNICDGLDDYDGDYTRFAKLGNVITADIKHRIELEARKKLEAAVAAGEAEAEESDTASEETIIEKKPYAGADEPGGEQEGDVFG